LIYLEEVDMIDETPNHDEDKNIEEEFENEDDLNALLKSNYTIDEKGNEISVAKYLCKETFSLHSQLLQRRKFRVRGATANPEQPQLYSETFQKIDHIIAGGLAVVLFHKDDNAEETVYLGRILRISSGAQVIHRLELKEKTGREKVNFRWYLDDVLAEFKVIDNEYLSKNIICGVTAPMSFSATAKNDFLHALRARMDEDTIRRRQQRQREVEERFDISIKSVPNGVSRSGRQLKLKRK